jgi:hypothetical protein
VFTGQQLTAKRVLDAFDNMKPAELLEGKDFDPKTFTTFLKSKLKTSETEKCPSRHRFIK